MADELKPCPFCGGEAEVIWWRNKDAWFAEYGVLCKQCKIIMEGQECYRKESEAIEAWNRRGK